ncbi:MFS transporter [Salinarimonas ramus]|uniref:MFS transporter n=1 Tax=Salinarimonas ramus TaxID=690164 RepID=A0A917QK28_9HYPH|nr:MFS transporter [Salinarimonas ramus]GGK54331.1 MFS transporter [Salinarimonas ramus]
MTTTKAGALEAEAAPAHPGTDDALARRNAFVMAGAQALGGANPAIVISLGGIVGQSLAENPALATLPVSLLNLGLALGTIPAAMIMRRYGRRAGYVLGASIGVVAGAIASVGIVREAFYLFCLGTFVAGMYGSYVQSYRYAAADTASPAFKARAISWVMAGGLVAGIIGPQVVILTREAIPEAPFAGAFLAQAALALVSILVVSLFRAPARPAASAAALPGSAAAKADTGRPLSVIVRQGRFVVAVIAGLVSYGLMSFLMTATPLAMVGCGLPVETAALGISWHILAMFAPAFFTGRLIDRFGKETITAIGLVLTAIAAAINLSGLTVAHFWGGLVLLGLGWNFGFIGATAMVTDCHRPEERTKVQAANDFLVFGSVAIASFSAGKLLDLGGWETLNWLVFPPIVLALVLVALQARAKRLAAA